MVLIIAPQPVAKPAAPAAIDKGSIIVVVRLCSRRRRRCWLQLSPEFPRHPCMVA